MQKNYDTYSAEQFLEDAFFIEWIKYQTPEAQQFWAAWMKGAPANVKAMQEAEVQLRVILSVERIKAEEEARQVWLQVQHTLQQHALNAAEVKGSDRTKIRPMYRWVAAAAVLVCVVYGVRFLSGRSKVHEPSVAANTAPAKQDIAPGGDKAVLTLADGTNVILDTANNGAITKQGNVTVIKLNGQLAYNKETNVPTKVLYNTITTPRGGQYQLVLADGSKVWLNAESSLRFPTAFAGKDRIVELTGEGYFEVAHNAEQPFHVKVNSPSGDGGMDVQVLGTHFNINSYDDEPSIKTTLLEGRVQVKKGDKNVFLNPGQQVETLDARLVIHNDVDIDAVIAWKNGLIYFEGADLAVIMRQISRWYNIDADYTGDPKTTHLSGKVSRNLSLSQIIKILETSGIDIKMDGKKLIATPKP